MTQSEHTRNANEHRNRFMMWSNGLGHRVMMMSGGVFTETVVICTNEHGETASRVAWIPSLPRDFASPTTTGKPPVALMAPQVDDLGEEDLLGDDLPGYQMAASADGHIFALLPFIFIPHGNQLILRTDYGDLDLPYLAGNLPSLANVRPIIMPT